MFKIDLLKENFTSGMNNTNSINNNTNNNNWVVECKYMRGTYKMPLYFFILYLFY